MKNLTNPCRNGVYKNSFLRIVVILTAFLMGTTGFGQQIKTTDRSAILAVMAAQEAAWNTGNLEGFMEGYWRSDSLRFIGKSGITYGWQPTLDNYHRGYPDQKAMGTLTFTILRVEGTGKKSAYVTGKWHLERIADAPEGYFTLLWRKIGGKWVIVADHSS